MSEIQLDKKALQKEIKGLRNALKKSEDNAIRKKERISALQTELDEINNEIETTKAQIAEKDTLIKKAEYSPVLDKLDNAALDKLSKRQTEQLVKMIESGDISALLGDDDTKVDTNSNAILNKKEGI